MALSADREILDVARHTEHVTFQKSTRKTKSGFDLPMLLHDRLAFSPEEYVRRYDVIQDGMAKSGLDALLIRGPENIAYFSGYELPGYYRYHCIVVPKHGEPVFVVRDFEWINSPEFAWSSKLAKVYDWDDSPSVTSNVLEQLGLGSGKRVGVEKRGFFYTVDEHETLTPRLSDQRVRRRHADPLGCPHDQVGRGSGDDAPFRGARGQGDAGRLRGDPAGGLGRRDQRRGEPDPVRQRRRVHGPAALRAGLRTQLPAAPDRRLQPAEGRRPDVLRDLRLAASLHGRADAHDLRRQAQGRVAAGGASLHRLRSPRRSSSSSLA